MRELIESKITLFSELVMLALAIIWYIDGYQIEPLIAIIALSTSVIISFFFRIRKKSQESVKKHNKISIKGNKNKVIQNNKGTIQIKTGTSSEKD